MSRRRQPRQRRPRQRAAQCPAPRRPSSVEPGSRRARPDPRQDRRPARRRARRLRLNLPVRAAARPWWRGRCCRRAAGCPPSLAAVVERFRPDPNRPAGSAGCGQPRRSITGLFVVTAASWRSPRCPLRSRRAPARTSTPTRSKSPGHSTDAKQLAADLPGTGGGSIGGGVPPIGKSGPPNPSVSPSCTTTVCVTRRITPTQSADVWQHVARRPIGFVTPRRLT